LFNTNTMQAIREMAINVPDITMTMTPRPEPAYSPRASVSGYGEWKFDRRSLEERAQRAILALKTAMRVNDTNVVVVHGTSGTMLIGAIMLLWQGDNPPRFVMLRKEGEEAHGCSIETGGDGFHLGRYLFLDDLICTGSTVSRVKNRLRGADMVGIVLHTPHEGRLQHGGLPVYST
jgi:hypothetical protein